jgi:hypothetical protein
LDTEQTRVRGAATVNLRDERFDATLTPQAKQTRVIALGSAIHAYGSFRHPAYAITKGTTGRDFASADAGACAGIRQTAARD